MKNQQHVSILDFLYCARNLKELVLDQCSVHLPNPEGFPNFQPHEKLKKFHLVQKTSCFLASDCVPYSIAKLIPNLEELVLRPEEGQNMPGFLLNDILQLARLKKLQRLEVPASCEDCLNNMPEFVYVLREFPSLRYLSLSWGLQPPDTNSSRLYRMVAWLEHVLKADNANIHLQMCYDIHHNIYTNTPSYTSLS